MQKKWSVTALMLTLSAGFGCGGSNGSDSLPDSPPTAVEELASEGFSRASAVAARPDGSQFFVAAYDDENRPGVFAVDSNSGAVSPLHVGDPLMYPTDLAASCDGNTLYVSDFGLGAPVDDQENSLDEAVNAFTGIHAVSSDNGTVTAFSTEGISRASGLIVSADCNTLYVSGFTDMGAPAVFTIPVEGGPANVLYEGEPLRSPTGIHVDENNVAWVMDHIAAGDDGEGSLFSIDPQGNIKSVASGLPMGRHGGVSLAPGGKTAVIPVSDEILGSRLITANTENGETTVIDTPGIEAPSGVAAAREAPVMVVAGENSIHIATFDQ